MFQQLCFTDWLHCCVNVIASLKSLKCFFRLSDAMEDDEEHSEAQESDSRFGKASKVEESFRLFHELYLKPVCPVRKLQVYFLYSNIMQPYYMLSGLFQRNMNIHWNVSFLVSFVIQEWIQSRFESHFFLFGGLGCSIHTKCRFAKNETWCCNLVWGKHGCRREFIVHSFVCSF